jgi:hypothetical protein
VLLLLFAAIETYDRALSGLERSATGRACWIWLANDNQRPQRQILAATRSFEIDETILSARVKIFVDRSYTLWINGSKVGAGGMRPGDRLDVYDVLDRLRRGRNDIEIVASSPTGVGGILFALDLWGHGRNAVVSDRSWRVAPLAVRGPGTGSWRAAWVWGRPPMYPWGYPALPASGPVTRLTRRESDSRAATQ